MCTLPTLPHGAGRETEARGGQVTAQGTWLGRGRGRRRQTEAVCSVRESEERPALSQQGRPHIPKAPSSVTTRPPGASHAFCHPASAQPQVTALTRGRHQKAQSTGTRRLPAHPAPAQQARDWDFAFLRTPPPMLLRRSRAAGASSKPHGRPRTGPCLSLLQCGWVSPLLPLEGTSWPPSQPSRSVSPQANSQPFPSHLTPCHAPKACPAAPEA